MKNLVQHIESLIIKHECVIVPGLGGFLTYRDSAVVRNNRLYAPTQRIRFNSLLTHHDGLLAEAYMQDRHISYTEALEAIKSDVEQITSSLKTGNTFLFGRIGALSLVDGNITLRDNDCKFLPENIGLPIVQLKQLETQNNNTITLNVPRTTNHTLRYVASIAVIMLITLFIPNPINEHSQRASLALDSISRILISDYRLQFLNSTSTTDDVVQLTTYNESESDIQVTKYDESNSDIQVTKYDESNSDIQVATYNDETTSNDETVTTQIETISHEEPLIETESKEGIVENTEVVEEIKEVENLAKSQVVEKEKKTSNSTQNRYHLIIASFTSIEDAEKYISRHTHFDQSQLEIIESNGKYRVSAESFSKYKEAIQYVDSVRNEVPAAKKAWILCK